VRDDTLPPEAMNSSRSSSVMYSITDRLLFIETVASLASCPGMTTRATSTKPTTTLPTICHACGTGSMSSGTAGYALILRTTSGSTSALVKWQKC
jgi:hypothetical protein